MKSMTRNCKQCGEPAQMFEDCDTIGCIKCDIWLEQPHACTLMYGGCCSGYSDAPEKPSLYEGTVRYI